MRFGYLSVILLASAASFGCVPVIDTYYRPSAQIGYLVHDRCAGQAPKRVLEVPVPPASIGVVLYGSVLVIRIDLPEGASAKFLDQEVRFGAGENAPSVILGEVSSSDPTIRGRVLTPPTQVFLGGDIDLWFGQKTPVTYESDVSLPLQDAQSYDVLLPRIEINGRIVQIPIIRFERHKGLGIYPVNC